MSSSDPSSQAADMPEAGTSPNPSPAADVSPETGIDCTPVVSESEQPTQTSVESETPASLPPPDDSSSPTAASLLPEEARCEVNVPSPILQAPALPNPQAVPPVAAPEPPPIPPSPQPLQAQNSESLKSAIAPRLPNASVGKPYSRKARELFGDQAGRVGRISITPPPYCGLVFDAESETLQGTPTSSGEFKLTLSYHPVSGAPDRPALTHEVALTINPDPASLWQNKPSDSNGPFAKPDTDKAGLSTSQLTAIAASLRGRSHAHEGKYREDDFAMHLVEETGWHLFIVADGAGSARFSRRGSQLACATALAKLTQWFTPGNQLDDALIKLGANAEEGEGLEKLRRVACNPLMAAAYEAFLAIRKEAEEHQATPRDFATTFIAVIARKVASRWFFASFAIGDGGAGVMIAPGKLQPLTQPDSGEFAGQTVFLTMPQVFQNQQALLARAQAAFCEDFRFLAVMTDGITDPIFQNDAALLSAAAWEKWEKQLTGVVNLETLAPDADEALLQWLHFPSPGNHDDRTLILAVPKGAGSPS